MLFAEEDNNFNSRLKPNWAGSVCVLVYCFYILNFSSIPQWQARAIFYIAYVLVTILNTAATFPPYLKLCFFMSTFSLQIHI